MEIDYGIDLSSLNLLSDVAGLESSINDSGSDFSAVHVSQILADLRALKNKGLLAFVENMVLIPKRKRSKLLKMGNDFLGFEIPKKKRSDNRCFNLKKTRVLKRTRVWSGFGGDDGDDVAERVKRQRTVGVAGLAGSSSLSSLFPQSGNLWVFRKKSALRFSLIKVHSSIGVPLTLNTEEFKSESCSLKDESMTEPEDHQSCTSAASISGSESDGSDWSIGWLESHGPEFQSQDDADDSFVCWFHVMGMLFMIGYGLVFSVRSMFYFNPSR